MTLALGAALVVLGLGGYLLTGGVSLTALIPAAFGLLFVAAGLLARSDRWRMHAMHAAVLIALLGFLGSARGLLGIPKVLDGTAVRPAAIVSQSFMAVLTLAYVVFSVRSFIAARRARRAASALLLMLGAASTSQAADIRVMSYNIKHGQTNAACTPPATGTGQPPSPDCNLDLQAAVAVIKAHDPDIVGLQEIDRGWARSAGADQPEALAAALGMTHRCYGANLSHQPDAHADRPHQYGTLILSRHPILTCGSTLLPRTGEAAEQRGFTLAIIDVNGVPLRFYNTHLHTAAADRALQVEAIGKALDVAAAPLVITGDFNARPTAPELQPLFGRLTDAWAKAGVREGSNPDGLTSPADATGQPRNRIDYAFVSPSVTIRAARVVVDEQTKLASDHYPLIVDLTLPDAQPKPAPTLISATKIWDTGAHNAFTDLIRWRNRWFCTFREADAHVGGDGRIRVLTSADGQTWTSAALVAEPGIDLRDPKMSITPDDRLMIVAGGSIYEGTTYKGRQPRVLFSTDGTTWSAPERILAEGDWLWRVTWHDGTAYGVTYRPKATGPAESSIVLVSSPGGRTFHDVAVLDVDGRPNETTLRFMPDGEMIALVRREASSRLAWIGRSRRPYTSWTWRETPHFVGGPNFIRLSNGELWASGRSIAGKPTTVIARMTPDGGYEPALTLPSGGDTSYAGMVWHDGLLWVSYYASHEGRTAIYLAKVKLPR
jgi:endonuclease/exonuclease/phosphatase family metal-dependent hydrolase